MIFAAFKAVLFTPTNVLSGLAVVYCFLTIGTTGLSSKLLRKCPWPETCGSESSDFIVQSRLLPLEMYEVPIFANIASSSANASTVPFSSPRV